MTNRQGSPQSTNTDRPVTARQPINVDGWLHRRPPSDLAVTQQSPSSHPAANETQRVRLKLELRIISAASKRRAKNAVVTSTARSPAGASWLCAKVTFMLFSPAGDLPTSV